MIPSNINNLDGPRLLIAPHRCILRGCLGRQWFGAIESLFLYATVLLSCNWIVHSSENIASSNFSFVLTKPLQNVTLSVLFLSLISWQYRGWAAVNPAASMALFTVFKPTSTPSFCSFLCSSVELVLQSFFSVEWIRFRSFAFNTLKLALSSHTAWNGLKLPTTYWFITFFTAFQDTKILSLSRALLIA